MKFNTFQSKIHNMYTFYNKEIAIDFTDVKIINYGKTIKSIADIENISYKISIYEVKESSKGSLVTEKPFLELDVIESSNILNFLKITKELKILNPRKNGKKIVYNKDLYYIQKEIGNFSDVYLSDYYYLTKIQNKKEIIYKFETILRKNKERIPNHIKEKYFEGNKFVLYGLRNKELNMLQNMLIQMLEDNINKQG